MFIFHCKHLKLMDVNILSLKKEFQFYLLKALFTINLHSPGTPVVPTTPKRSILAGLLFLDWWHISLIVLIFFLFFFFAIIYDRSIHILGFAFSITTYISHYFLLDTILFLSGYMLWELFQRQFLYSKVSEILDIGKYSSFSLTIKWQLSWIKF